MQLAVAFIILLMLILSAFFSGSETAFVSANRLKAEVEAQRHGQSGKNVRYFLDRPSRFLTTTLVGNNISLVVYSMSLAFLLEPALNFLTDSALAILVIQTLVGSIIVLLVGEVIPKTIAQQRANSLLRPIATPLKLTYYLFFPIIKVSGWIALGLARLLKAEPESMNQFLLTDFENLLQENVEIAGQDPDELDDDERELVSNVLSLRTMQVSEAMVPRISIDAVREDASVEEIRDVFIQTGRSKLPVYRDNIDNIIGFVLVHDLFDEPETLSDMLREIRFIPESKRSNELLRDFLDDQQSIAVVLDEHGGTAGLVTVEDLLEELIGEIEDEYDQIEVVIRKTDDGYIVSGRAEVDILRDEYDLDLPEGEYETIAGYLLDRLGSIPAKNESHTFDGYVFTVLKASPKRVDLIKIVQVEEETEVEDE